MQVTEGNCSDAQQICCDSSNTYYNDNGANNSLSNDGENDNIHPNDKNKKYDSMCGPNDVNRYAEDDETTKGQGISTGARCPHAGRWFEEGL